MTWKLPPQSLEQQRWQAEEYECVIMFLNNLDVPKEDENGREYSAVGRIMHLMRMCEAHNYTEQKLSASDFAELTLKKLQI